MSNITANTANIAAAANAAAAAKYTACLIEQSDKDYLVELRKASGYTEKELLGKVVALAKANEATIIAEGQADLAAYKEAQKVKSVARYEEAKLIGKQARAAARVAREHQKAVAAAVPATTETPAVEGAVASETPAEGTVGEIA